MGGMERVRDYGPRDCLDGWIDIALMNKGKGWKCCFNERKLTKARLPQENAEKCSFTIRLSKQSHNP